MFIPVRNVRIITALAAFLAVMLFFISCSTLAPLKPFGPCVPDFPDGDGWYGGDGAYSILLDQRRTLWLFGDTFASDEKEKKDRIGMDVILGTTLAVSTCSLCGKFSIRYFLKQKNGRFVSSFGEKEWLWPQAPFIADGVLYIPLLVIESIPGAEAPFNFRVAGHTMAQIRDFRAEDPRNWTVEYADWTGALPSGIEALATTSVVYRNHVYFYPLMRSANITGNILARIAVCHLESPRGHLEYLTKNSGWQKELKAGEVKIIFPATVSELSVRYSEHDRRWIAVYSSPEDKGFRLLYTTAGALEGPWAPPEILVDAIDDVNPASPRYDRHTFCYAGKEHPQFAFDARLVVTYVCNSSEDLKNENSFLRRNLFLYRPQVKIIRPR